MHKIQIVLDSKYLTERQMDCEGDDYVCVGKTSTDVEGILRSKRKEN